MEEVKLDDIQKGLSLLTRKWAYIGRLICRCDFEYTDEILSAATDAEKKVWLNKKFFSRFPNEGRAVLLAHEMLHILCRNLSGEKVQEDKWIWNIAEDIVINTMISDHFCCFGMESSEERQRQRVRMEIPKDLRNNSLFPEEGNDTVKFQMAAPMTVKKNGVKYKTFISEFTVENVRKKSVTDIYWELWRQIDHDKETANNGGTGVETIDDHSRMKDDPEKKVQKKWQKTANNEAVICDKLGEGKGDTSGKLDAMVDAMKQPTISWRELLRNAISASVITDVAYRKFNRRSVSLGTPLPGYVKEGLNVAVHVDTSGSTYQYLTMFFSELSGIMKQYPGASIKVIQCDCDIQRIDEFSADTVPPKFEVSGLGGTSHRPVVDWVNKQPMPPEVLISFTDGESDVSSCYPDLRSGVSRIFVLPKGGSTTSVDGYGTVIVVDEDPDPAP